MSIKYSIEVTDTFSGEANYSWVKRGTATVAETNDSESYKRRELRNRRAVAKRVREIAGWPVCVRITIEDQGDTYTIRPAGMCQVAFATCEG